MEGEGSFTRANVLVTAFKRLGNGRVLPVRGCFRRVRASGIALRSSDRSCPVTGRIEIDLASLTTDAPERDANVLTHLFRGAPTVSASVEPGGDLTSVGSNAWSWRGSVALSLGARFPVHLALQRRRLVDRVELSARLKRPLEIAITELGFPFHEFVEAVGNGSVVDRVELDVGIVLDERATRPRVRVAIAGGGIAGLSAAQVLIDAGCDVTVVEKEPVCGGKLTSYVDEALGHTVEHGIHGIFPRYQNLVALWRDAGIGDEVFADTRTLGVASPTGMTAGHFHELSARAPFFLREMIPDGVFRGRDAAACAALLGRVYGASADRTQLDRETFQALLDRYGVTGRLQRFLMHPYVKNLAYARPDQVSAAVACDALGYYLLENAEDFKARWFDGGPQELVIDPWVAELARRGVRFLTRTPVQFVVFEGGRFHGLATRALLAERQLGKRERCWVQRFGARPVALRWRPDVGELRAWDGLCTHAGCPLQPAGDNGASGFWCACHGGAFDNEGRVVRAPPKRDLPVLPVAREETGGEAFWKFSLEEGSDAEALLAADYGVVALDIEGARRVLTPALLDLASTRGIPMLRTTPLVVLRMWFRGTTYAGPDSGFFAEGDLLDNFFVLSRFQREFREVKDHTIVECHIGDAAPLESRDDEDILMEAARRLSRYFGELGPETLDVERSRVLRHREGFPLFAPGDASRAPTVAASDRPNLVFAGDWVRSDVRSWYMERAAVTGIEAANHILAKEGCAKRAIRASDHGTSVVQKLIALPFHASSALGRAYRTAVGDASSADAFDSGQWRVWDKRAWVDLAELIDHEALSLVHPFVREFYADPTRFEVTVHLHASPLVEKVVRRSVPISPLYAARKGADNVGVVDGCMREIADVGGFPLALDFRAIPVGEGVRFELARATPSFLLGSVGISYETSPTRDGVRSVGAFRHRLLRATWTIEFLARRREELTVAVRGRVDKAATSQVPIPVQSEARLRSATTAHQSPDAKSNASDSPRTQPRRVRNSR